MAFQPHRFGRYIIVDPVAVGGMAEIYRARVAASKEGPDRILVIKKVIANLSQNSEFIQMFEEEIKITVGLTHPNIIQIYDYGKVDDQYFMAMEYVEGKNLRQFVKRLADMKSMFSIDMSCHIISQVCHALAYAHNYRDRLSGKPLGIVHRDISPQNVMISYDGAVKLFDFGIAKAKSASEATRAGVIKGKPSYLSPEQINGEELDGRCDIFALGIVLWELLTAKRLFVSETDMGVLRLIQSAKIEPPSTFNPVVPQSLDAIVIKSLTRDKNKRYQGAEEFQRDLHKFLYSFNPSFNPADLSYYAQELFKAEIHDDRERLSKYLAMEPVVDGKDSDPKKNLSTKLADGLISTTDFNRDAVMQLQTSGNVKVDVGSSGTKKINRPVVSTNKDNMVIPPWSKQSIGTNGAPRVSTRTTNNSTALSKELNDQSNGSGRNMTVLLTVLLVFGLFAARQYGYLDGTPLSFLGRQEEPRVADVEIPKTQTPQPPPVATPQPDRPVAGNNKPDQGLLSGEGLIILQTNAIGYKVFVKGRPVPVHNNQFTAPLNEDLFIDVTKFGYQTARFRTKLNGQAPVAFRVDLVPLPSGIIHFTTTPETKLTFTLNGEKVWETQTPVRNQAIPVGQYHVLMENNLLNLRAEENIKIEAGKATRVERVLGR